MMLVAISLHWVGGGRGGTSPRHCSLTVFLSPRSRSRHRRIVRELRETYDMLEGAGSLVMPASSSVAHL